jgi:acyl dehydratase
MNAVGFRTAVRSVLWDSSDCLLYAVGVGAGPESLAFVTENSAGVRQQVLPTFVTTRNAALDTVWEAAGVTDRRTLVHGGQHTWVPQPLTTEREVELSAVLVGLFDTGRHAQLEIAHEGVDLGTDDLVFRCTQTLVLRDHGGFGGPPPPVRISTIPVDVTPQVSEVVGLAANQALVYRLSGDRNPLHSDPSVATRVGFERPILHGLCTYGIAARVALRTMLDDDPECFDAFSARFTGPVFPGTSLTVQMWSTDAGVAVRVVGPDDRTVLDDGLLTARPPAKLNI